MMFAKAVSLTLVTATFVAPGAFAISASVPPIELPLRPATPNVRWKPARMVVLPSPNHGS